MHRPLWMVLSGGGQKRAPCQRHGGFADSTTDVRTEGSGMGQTANLTTATRQVLVVGDDPQTCQLIAEGLAGAGHTAQVAGSVLEALEQLATEAPDLVVSTVDIDLPGGGEVLRVPDPLDLDELVATVAAR